MNKLKIFLLSILTLLVIIPLKTNIITTTKKETYIDKKPMKVDITYKVYAKKEDGKYLDDVRWQVSSYNSLFLENSNKVEDYYLISLHEESLYTDKIFSYKQKKLIETIKDTKNLEKQENVNCTYSETTKKYTCKLLLPTVFYLEQKQVPDGYAKEKFILPGKITISYEVLKEFENPTILDDEIANIFPSNIDLKLSSVLLESIDNGTFLEYSKKDDDILLGTSLEEALLVWDKTQLRKNDKASITITNTAKKIALEIKNYVNDKTSIKTIKNKKVTFKVIVKNIGEKNAVDSLVTSKLPDNFIYEEGSASNGGIYQNGEVHWYIDNIDENEELVLTYEAYAAKNISISKDYINSASISNFALDNRIDSNRTLIKVLFINPEYGVYLIILGFIITLVSILISILKKTKTKQEEFI